MMKVPVPIIRSLQELSADGKFKIFAVDHRDVFVDMLKNAGKYQDETSVVASKLDLIKKANGLVSGYLVDPFYALPGAILDGSLPGSVGFMIQIENNDYRIESIGSEYYIHDLTPETIKRIGASAVKLFLYYHPESEYAEPAEKEIRQIALECIEHRIPFLVEPVLYLPDDKATSPVERVQLTFEMIRRMSGIPITLFKLCFPGDVDCFCDDENIAICRRVTEMINVPWVIMSSDVSDSVFEKQLELACKGGASGYVAGRAIWKDFVLADSEHYGIELAKMRQRLIRINAIVDRYASVWSDHIVAEEQPASEWYVRI